MRQHAGSRYPPLRSRILSFRVPPQKNDDREQQENHNEQLTREHRRCRNERLFSRLPLSLQIIDGRRNRVAEKLKKFIHSRKAPSRIPTKRKIPRAAAVPRLSQKVKRTAGSSSFHGLNFTIVVGEGSAAEINAPATPAISTPSATFAWANPTLPPPDECIQEGIDLNCDDLQSRAGIQNELAIICQNQIVICNRSKR